MLLLCTSIFSALTLFLVSVLYIGYSLLGASTLLSLLIILVYLGALLILFAYIWIYIPYLTTLPNLCYLVPLFLLSLFWSSSLSPASLSPYLYPSSLVLFLVGLLF